MTARVLVVDDVFANLKLLEARLTAEYFVPITATNGYEALEICKRGACDIVLLDVMMPGLDGFEVCRLLKQDPDTLHLPVIMVTSLDQTADRVRGLEAGADDFLTKPVDEIALLARVRSLSRIKTLIDELRARSSATAGLGGAALDHCLDDGRGGRVLLVEDRVNAAGRVAEALRPFYDIDIEADAREALSRAARTGYEIAIVSLDLADYDGLRLCGQLRSLERSRHTPLLILADAGDRARILRGLDMGVNDYLQRPIDRDEIVARVRTQVRGRRYADSLRSHARTAMELALVDPLTGLNNRRYLESRVAALLEQASRQGRPVSSMILDIDHFKAVNDAFGHDAGDEVLKTFAARVKRMVRGADLLCRFGGEEFVVIMPDTMLSVAALIGERIRAAVAGAPFPVEKGARAIDVTVSIGIAEGAADDTPDALFRRADRALYQSKHSGRNKVTATAACEEAPAETPATGPRAGFEPVIAR